MESEPQCYFVLLSTEILIKIFNYLDIFALCRLRRTCKRFNDVISSWDYVLLKNAVPLVTNQQSDLFLLRCQQHLPIFEKIRISKNWQIGQFTEKALLGVKRKYMPWLYLTDKSVWLSRGKTVYCYERADNSVNVSKPRMALHGRSRSDVGHYQLKNNLVISGHRDGSIWLKSLHDDKMIFDEKHCHESDINSIDISQNGEIVVSGSRDSTFKVWRVDYDSGALKRCYYEIFFDRVLKVSLLDEQPLLAVGTSGNDYRAPLFVYDVERVLKPVELSVSCYGAGVLDLKWDGPHTIWTCGYDTCLRRWDLRVGKCVQSLCDPHASVLYCLEYDYYNSIMTGTQSYGRVILWDVRRSQSVQLYFMDCCKGSTIKSSPVYSLSFDSESLFTATDRNLNVLNFSDHNGIVQDYSFCCK